MKIVGLLLNFCFAYIMLLNIKLKCYLFIQTLLIIPIYFLGLLGIVRGVTAMCGPPLGGLIFEKFEVINNDRGILKISQF